MMSELLLDWPSLQRMLDWSLQQRGLGGRVMLQPDHGDLRLVVIDLHGLRGRVRLRPQPLGPQEQVRLTYDIESIELRKLGHWWPIPFANLLPWLLARLGLAKLPPWLELDADAQRLTVDWRRVPKLDPRVPQTLRLAGLEVADPGLRLHFSLQPPGGGDDLVTG